MSKRPVFVNIGKPIYVVTETYFQKDHLFSSPRLFESVKDARKYKKWLETIRTTNLVAVDGPWERTLCWKK